MRRKHISEQQTTLAFAKRHLLRVPKATKTPKPRTEWVVFGGDKKVVTTIKAYSYNQAISGLRHRKKSISLGSQGYLRPTTDFPPDAVFREGTYEDDLFGTSLASIGQVFREIMSQPQ
ncbi:hypothetical protein A2V71_04340 [Candidatus Berkelbacteria bacterium RBG_13_40_8]|uniref:Uncharacterized protein n=1 Tax=Candidatus Berkelbacteria bacterium RBG_13_40_8 TaxID=1797467 RepID=A0A1F5DNK5_9BACT|nr:MAG: hypothetical protein A2V71_04340 [Candidatus Berkelbacteria bacterium RBG_13_40_8]